MAAPSRRSAAPAKALRPDDFPERCPLSHEHLLGEQDRAEASAVITPCSSAHRSHANRFHANDTTAYLTRTAGLHQDTAACPTCGILVSKASLNSHSRTEGASAVQLPICLPSLRRLLVVARQGSSALPRASPLGCVRPTSIPLAPVYAIQLPTLYLTLTFRLGAWFLAVAAGAAVPAYLW
jgi:hypothetical protein